VSDLSTQAIVGLILACSAIAALSIFFGGKGHDS